MPDNAQYSEYKSKTQHWTPEALADELVNATFAPLTADVHDVSRLLSLRVCDPSMGEGALLSAAFRHLRQQALVLALGKPDIWWLRGTLWLPRPGGMDALDSDIRLRIVEDCLWGVELDKDTASNSILTLYDLAGAECADNVYDGDCLVADVPNEGHFDAVLLNPPFVAGPAAKRFYGDEWGPLQDWAISFGGDSAGKADLAAYHLLRAAVMVRPGGVLGCIATNTIHQGATRRLALGPLVSDWGWQIFWARRDVPWPGDAAVTVSMFAMRAPDNWVTEPGASEKPQIQQLGNQCPGQCLLFT